jgi:hypothetical protein
MRLTYEISPSVSQWRKLHSQHRSRTIKVTNSKISKPSIQNWAQSPNSHPMPFVLVVLSLAAKHGIWPRQGVGSVPDEALNIKAFRPGRGDLNHRVAASYDQCIEGQDTNDSAVITSCCENDRLHSTCVQVESTCIFYYGGYLEGPDYDDAAPICTTWCSIIPSSFCTGSPKPLPVRPSDDEVAAADDALEQCRGSGLQGEDETLACWGRTGECLGNCTACSMYAQVIQRAGLFRRMVPARRNGLSTLRS